MPRERWGQAFAIPAMLQGSIPRGASGRPLATQMGAGALVRVIPLDVAAVGSLGGTISSLLRQRQSGPRQPAQLTNGKCTKSLSDRATQKRDFSRD
jgi:hypothetical protein